MDQIRCTMMQHEALFKEQVQALHKLYSIQKSAMQEMRKIIYSQPQVLAVNFEGVVLENDQLHGPVLEGKSLRQAYATGHSYKEEQLSLSLHPFCTSERLKVRDSNSWMNGSEVETSHAARSKSVRNFDLEKLPEDCMDESESQTEPINSETPDANSILARRTSSTDDISFLGDASLEKDLQMLKQTSTGTNLRVLPDPNQEINLSSDQASASKVCEIDIKKFDTSSHNSNSITEKKTSPDVADRYLPAFGNSDASQDSRHLATRLLEKPILSHQGSSNFTKLSPRKLDRLHPERSAEQAKGTNFPASSELHQYLESDSTSTISTAHRKLEEQINDYVGGVSFTKSRVISSQGSLTRESLQYRSKDQIMRRSLSLETNSSSGKQGLQSTALISEKDGQNENSNDSGNGSNSMKVHNNLSCEYKIIGQRSNGRDETVKLEKGDSRRTKDVIRPSFSSTLSDTEMKFAESDSFSNSRTDSKTILVKETEEDREETDDPALEEASESIAAEILLSFVSRSQVNPHDIDEKLKIGDQRCANNSSSSGNGIDESIKWTNSIIRRRTLRRPR